MGGFQRSSSNDGSGPGTGAAGGSSSTTADGGLLQPLLSASQEASMRQLKEERDAACAQVEDLEATVKELVAAMDDATKAKVDLQAEFDAFKNEAEESKEALTQAINAAHRGHDRLDAIRARIAAFQAQAADLRQGKKRLVALLKDAREEACALYRWNRQELRARREAEREAHQLRRRVARLLVVECPRRGGGRLQEEGQEQEEQEEGLSSSTSCGERGQEEVDVEMVVCDTVHDEEDGAAMAVIEPAVVIASLEARVGELEGQISRALEEKEDVMAQATAVREEAVVLAAARDEAYAQQVQAEQGVEGAVRRALEEREVEMEGLRVSAARVAAAERAERELVEERAQVRALEARLAAGAASVEEAEARVRASVDEVVGLRIREEELLGRMQEMEAAHGQCETRLAAVREERDEWRRRAETEVAEWVGVSMEDDGTDLPPAETAAAKTANADAAADASGGQEQEEGGMVPDVGPVVTPPSSEELGGLDPVQALVEENMALRAALERLRGL